MICDSRFGCATSGAFGAFVDGIVRSLVHSHGIVMAKTKSRNRSLAARVLVVRLSGLAIIAAYLLGAIWAAGNSTMPLAAGISHGSDFQEAIIKIVAYSSAPTGMIFFALILWGLRIDNTQSRNG